MTIQENRGLFLMLPDCLLDDENLSGNCIIGFARLMRYCQQQRSHIFTGSLKKLARITKLSKSTARFFIPQWQERNLLTQDEDEDGIMTLTLHISELWQENVTYSEPLMTCATTKQSSTTTKLDSTVAKPNNTIDKQSSTTTVRNVQPASTNEGGNTIRLYKNKEEGEEESHSPTSFKEDDTEQLRDDVQPNVQEDEPTKPDIPSMQRGSFLPSKNKTFQQAKTKNSPIPLFPQGKEKDPRSMTAREQKRTAERAAEEERAAIWSCVEQLLGTKFPRGIRESVANTRGIDGLMRDGYTPDDIERGVKSLEAFHLRNLKVNFTLEKLYLGLPGMLSTVEAPTEEKQKENGNVGSSATIGDYVLFSSIGR